MTAADLLAAELALPCGAVLPNRIAKAAMSEQLAARDGRPTERLRRLYAAWAHGGAGLLITGNVMIDRTALTEPGNVILDHDRALPAFRRWAAAAKDAGSTLWMQINHPGRVATVPFTHRPVAPSATREPVPGYNLRRPRALTGQEVRHVVRAFARTAELAVAAGFDGIQIHAAHGYLLSQFLSPAANTRDDAYGRTAAGRRRALLETVAAVRAAVGPAVPVSVKLNSRDFQRGGLTEAEAHDTARALADAGIDLLEISGGNYTAPAMTGVGVHRPRTAAGPEAYFLDFAERIRHDVQVPLMLTGGLRTGATMERILRDGTADVIGLARPMAFSPQYPAHLLAGTRPARRAARHRLPPPRRVHPTRPPQPPVPPHRTRPSTTGHPRPPHHDARGRHHCPGRPPPTRHPRAVTRPALPPPAADVDRIPAAMSSKRNPARQARPTRPPAEADPHPHKLRGRSNDRPRRFRAVLRSMTRNTLNERAEGVAGWVMRRIADRGRSASA
ncbi:NADH:flavin oxidoreductase/NADH oxidase family protein [Kitasatospora sp. NPDC005856]|uniref:NADH:flavin oxidoreductase/NADH oxidase family protein n=1 Tax=Kitasatospora sp. NPDC005856 TaxID=3154566 RepID=UPI0033D3E9F2